METSTDSTYTELLLSMLTSLARVRRPDGLWADAEEESTGTQAFKRAEALRAFYLYGAHETSRADRAAVPIDSAILLADTKQLFLLIDKYGFFPSPYSPVESTDQHTDFAAFILEFGDLVIRYLDRHSISDKDLRRRARNASLKAFSFLTDGDNYREDASGVRWAGTRTHTKVVRRSLTSFFTDTYFTAIVTMALNRAIESRVLSITSTQRDSATSLIQRAATWICGREKRGLLTGDEDRTNQALFYSTWGLRALAETHDTQIQDTQRLLTPLTGTYISQLAKLLDEKPIAITQDYLYVYSTELETLLPYVTVTFLALLSQEFQATRPVF